MRLSLFTVAAASLLALAGTASAAPPVLSSGTYHLNNHPDVGGRPPAYGLRLDGLDGHHSNRIYSFDFNDPRSNMLMNLDLANGIVRIYGESWGGHDAGNTYAPVNSGRTGLWAIDFTYRANVTVQSNGRVVVSNASAQNNGHIQPLFNSNMAAFNNHPQIPLVDFMGPSFILELGHRGFAGVSGYGWMNHSGRPHIAASDWLFTVGDVVPSPSAAFLGLIGLGSSAWVRRRLS